MVEDEKKDESAVSPDDWEYEYEYVEVPEGEELPEGEYEYEYVEVLEEDVPLSEQDIVSEAETSLPVDENVSKVNLTEYPELIISEDIDIDDLIAGDTSDTGSNISIDSYGADTNESHDNFNEDLIIDTEDDVPVIIEEDIHSFASDSYDEKETLQASPFSDEISGLYDAEKNEEYNEEEPEVIEEDIVIDSPVVEEVIDFIPDNIEKFEDVKEELPEISIQESFMEHDIVEDNSDWSKQLNASIIILSPADYQSSIETSKIFTKSSGISLYQGTKDKNSIFIGDVNFDNDELNFWKLIVFDKKVVAVKNNENKQIPLLKNAVRFAKLIKSGEEKLALFNDREFNFVSPADDFGVVEGKYIVGEVDDNTNLMINDFIHVPVKEYAGKKISFNKVQSGMLVGSDSSILYFADIKSIIIPDGIKHEVEEKDLSEVNLRWYSGSVDDKVFNISAATDATPISGSSDIDTIHIQAGTTTYGWNVVFDNGIVMSVRDLQTYQRRNGSMPSEKGVLSYGAKKFEFEGIKRIVLYLSPQYFSYK